MSENSTSNREFDPDEIEVIDDQQTLLDLPQRPSKFSKMRKTLGKITIEPFLFLYIVGTKLPEVPIENLLIYKVCLLKNFNDTVCDNLLSEKKYFIDKVIVQQSLSDWKIYIELMLALPMIFLAIVVGPWSDRFGRKYPLLIPIIGRIITVGCIFANVYYRHTSVIYLIVSFLPLALLGANIVNVIAFSYISDITTKKNRTIRIAVLSALTSLGEPVALLVGTKIYEHYGFYPVLITSFVCLTLSLIFGAISVKETIVTTDGTCHKIQCFFKPTILKECFKTLVKNRGRKKVYLWCYLLANVIFVLYRVADWKISYMFSQVKFQWSIDQYTKFSASRMVGGILVIIVIAPVLSKIYRVKDHTFTIIGMVSAVVCYLIFGMCNSVPLFYLGALIGSFMGLVYLGIMAAVSKLVDEDEQGKLYALLLTTEVVVPVLGTTFQLEVYKHTLKIFPGFVYCLNSALMIIPLIIVLWMKKDTQRKIVEASTQTEPTFIVT